MEEEQIRQLPKEKVQWDKQRSTKHTYITVMKWNKHFTESAIFPLRQCCIYKVGNPLVESSGFYIEVID